MRNRSVSWFQFSLIVVFLSSTSGSFSQNPNRCDLKFIDHLVNTGDFEEALYLLDSTDCVLSKSNDSVNYLRGWTLYSLKRLIPSAVNLIMVNPISENYLKSHFFAAYNYTHSGNYGNALETLSKIIVNSEKQMSLKNFESAGIYLLQGNTSMYDSSFIKADRNFYELTESFDNLQKIAGDLKNHRQKSPLVAGILSGLFPGSGKLYSRKRGEAISAFIATTGLGLVTWEIYRKNGLNNFKTIAFGTVFAISYAANIYGAVVTVNIIETEYRDNVKNTILFNLHIPLRNIFDK